MEFQHRQTYFMMHDNQLKKSIHIYFPKLNLLISINGTGVLKTLTNYFM